MTRGELGFDTEGDFDHLWEPLHKKIDKQLKGKKRESDETKDLAIDLLTLGLKQDSIFNYFNECLLKKKDERVIDPRNGRAVQSFMQSLKSQGAELTNVVYMVADDPEFYL